jgi:hypothetical protein
MNEDITELSVAELIARLRVVKEVALRDSGLAESEFSVTDAEHDAAAAERDEAAAVIDEAIRRLQVRPVR